MSFEEFRVSVIPQPGSPFAKGCDVTLFRHVVRDIQTIWPAIKPDTIETMRLFSPKEEREELLVHQTEAGLFQLTVLWGNVRPDTISIHLRLAYCNPCTIYAPFCSVVEELMRRYKMCAYCSEPAPPGADARETLCQHKDIRAVIIPRIVYGKVLWYSDVQSAEEAILRPGDAVARFVPSDLTTATAG